LTLTSYPPTHQKNPKNNRGLPAMMINTHVKFESNRAIRTYHLDKKFNVVFSIFSNSNLDLDFIPPKNNRGLPSLMFNTHVNFESNQAIIT